MILTIDIGNTHIAIGCSDGERLIFTERISTGLNRTPVEYAILFKSILELYKTDPLKIHGSVIASVVPSETNAVMTALEKITGKHAMVLGPGIKTGLSIIIDNPAQLGANLVAGAVAGIRFYGSPLIIFDMATATTVSVIDKNQNYIGGMILTGVSTAIDALIRKASLLQNVAIEKPKKIIGSNTADCIKSGAIYGTAAAMDGIIDRLEAEIGCKAATIASGPAAENIVPYCSHEIIIDNDLLMKGLVEIYKKNT